MEKSRSPSTARATHCGWGSRKAQSAVAGTQGCECLQQEPKKTEPNMSPSIGGEATCLKEATALPRSRKQAKQHTSPISHSWRGWRLKGGFKTRRVYFARLVTGDQTCEKANPALLLPFTGVGANPATAFSVLPFGGIGTKPPLHMYDCNPSNVFVQCPMSGGPFRGSGIKPHFAYQGRWRRAANSSGAEASSTSKTHPARALSEN